MSWMRSVYSDMAAEIGYDSDAQELLVVWKKSGKTSAYGPDFPEGAAEACANAPSVGQFLNSEVKPFYQHRYV